MEDYQARVIAEHAELRARLVKLEAWLELPEDFDPAEHDRMLIQLDLMRAYARVLMQRIEAFEPATP